MAITCGMNAYLACREPTDFLSFHLAPFRFRVVMESVPFNCMDNGDTESGNQANAKGDNDTANSDTQTGAVDGRNHLAGNNGSDNSPAYLHDNIEDTSKLRRPVAHEISADDLFEQAI